MSVPTLTAQKDSSMRNRAEDSLSDEFEIIPDHQSFENDTIVDDVTLQHWSQHNSIALNPDPFLNSMVPLPGLNSMAPLISINESLTYQEPSLIANDIIATQVETTLKGETPVMEGTIAIAMNDISLLESSGSITPDATLASVLNSQHETKMILEKTLASFENLSKEMEEVGSLKKDLASLATENSELKSKSNALEAVIAGLTETQNELKKKSELNYAPLEVVPSNATHQQIYELGLQVDQGRQVISQLRNELDAAHRRIADVSAPAEEAKNAQNQLDVMCAKYLEEKERRMVAEAQVQTARADNGGFSMSLLNEQMIVEQLKNKTEYAEKLEKQVEVLRIKLEDARNELNKKSADIENTKEIINVLNEDHLEGTRLLVEKDQKITTLERILQGLDRADVNH